MIETEGIVLTFASAFEQTLASDVCCNMLLRNIVSEVMSINANAVYVYMMSE